MGRLLGVGERKERSEGRDTGLPLDEAEGPILLATKLPKKASPAETREGRGPCQAASKPGRATWTTVPDLTYLFPTV